MKALVTLAMGDMRRALNILQSTSMASSEVSEVSVYTCVGHPLRKDIEAMVDWVLNENFTTAYKSILKRTMIFFSFIIVTGLLVTRYSNNYDIISQ